MVESKTLKRVFKHGDLELPDPDPVIAPDKVREMYSDTYPELLNASTVGPKVGESEVTYTFTKTTVGTKG